MLDTVDDDKTIRHETPMGEVYYIDKNTGEKIIKGTRRPDGSIRKDIKVRPGYTPREEQGVYIPKGKQKEVGVKSSIPGWDDSLISDIPNSGKKPGNRRKKKVKDEQVFSIIEGIEAIKISQNEENKDLKFKSNNKTNKRGGDKR